MQHKKMKSKNYKLRMIAVLPAAVFGVGLTLPSPVVYASIAEPDEIIVTARRTEEVIQNIPISITVFNQDMLNERNVVNGADLVAYTPSLSVNTQFGADNARFAIRGFTQELRTTSSVAVYFADVVAPRGGGSVQAGDGAGPGSFFDLQNVQVLKGPQGTLFGRNTTGGAIQLVPQEPTTKLEGYLEQSVGNYAMRRTQAVLNVPITDDVRARVGFDTQKRDGYLVNVSGIGPDRLQNVDYFAGRASVMWDIASSVRNYTIYSYTNSENKGSIEGLFACNPDKQLAPYCNSSLAEIGGGFYNVLNDVENPISKLKQMQLINTTTWDVSDELTVKNILSYADLENTTRFSNFGANLQVPALGHVWLFPAGTKPGLPTASQKTYVEELQFQGTALDDKLTWQGGLYYERSRPDGISGALSPSFAPCTNQIDVNAEDYNCPLISAVPGSGLASTKGTIEFINKAAYAQATYDITDEFRMTMGLRYTDDQTNADSQVTSYTFNAGTVNGFNCPFGGDPNNDCSKKLHQHSEAPTWLIDFDYLPSPDTMYYAKYARGYRQGSISIASPEAYQTFDPEKVDAYELGFKMTLRGPIPGTFNTALFYNELSNQQLQVGQVPCALATSGTCTPAPPGYVASATTAIVNAGSSTIQGVETDLTLKLLDDLVFNVAYTYLATRLDSQDVPPGAPGYVALPVAEVGGHLSFSPTNTVTTGLSYRLPIPADLGDLSAGATYTFIGDQISTVSTLGKLPSRRLLNLNMGWKSIVGSPFDASFFMTNALNEETTNYVPGVYDSIGAEFRVVGEPRMWGVRVKYNFGS